MDLWCHLLCLLENSKSACFRDPRKHHILVEAGLGPGRSSQCLHLSRGRERQKEEAGAKPQTSQQAPGRERPVRSCGQVEAAGQGETVAAGDVGKALTSPAGARDGKEGPCASGAAAGVPAPAVEEDRARSAQARRAGTVPAAPSSAAGAPGPGEDPAGGLGRVPHPLSPARLGERSGGAYLARPGRPRWAWLRGPRRNWLPGEGPVIRTRSW